MHDNKTSQPAREYDNKIEKTIPFYNTINSQVLDLVAALKPYPDNWLDTGCGTGILISKAIRSFEDTHFVLADPSEAMLEIAKEKLGDNKEQVEFFLAGTENLDLPSASFDVITAVLSHHYYDMDAKRKVCEKCYDMLEEGGAYITIESFKPQSEKGLLVGLKRWREAQLRQGKSMDEVEKHLSRYGKEFLPIAIDTHIHLLHNCGFSTVEVFWTSIMQVGIYAVK